MKQTGKCPKCSGSNIYFNDKKLRGGERNWLSVGFTNFFITTYICTDCGFIEEYVQDDSKFEKIRKHWTKLS